MSTGITNRDIKAQNVLVSNDHYAFESDTTMLKNRFKTLPVKCKLTDFGESRSIEVQTRAALETRTNRLNRGTYIFMAPELLRGKMKLKNASMNELLKADIFSLGALLHHLLAPDSHAFLLEFQSKELASEDIENSLSEFYYSGKLPKLSTKYAELQSTIWSKF